VRVDRVEPGESAGVGRAFMPAEPTSVALLPVGETDGYPAAAGDVCDVLIRSKRYPVVRGGVSSAHAIIDVGPNPEVSVGDTATLIGPPSSLSRCRARRGQATLLAIVIPRFAVTLIRHRDDRLVIRA
jgi:alanine racemase